MIQWIVNALLSPVISLGNTYIKEKSKREAIEAGVEKVALATEAATRPYKLANTLGQIPLFVAETSAALYLASIFLDSTFPSEFINPLELPNWFKPYFDTALASIFGLGAVKYATKYWNK